MPLNPAKLEKDLLGMIQEMQDETDKTASQQAYARKLRTIIHNYISSATVTFAPGTIQIIAAGSAGSNPAPVIGRLT